MPRRTRRRLLLRASLCVLVALLLLTAALRIETYLYRRQAEHLMADLQSLNLRHSTWSEAQILITRWGSHGHYEGTCDSSFCRYTITLESPQRKLEEAYFENRKSDVGLSTTQFIFSLCERLGGRSSWFKGTFLIQDGIVLRKGEVFAYQVVPNHPDVSPYILIATSRAVDRVISDGWTRTGTNQLALHPFYLVLKRPGGCETCMLAHVAFSPDTPDIQIRALTTFDLSCLTRFHSCQFLEDIFPAAMEWHVYDASTGPHPANGLSFVLSAPRPLPCDVPLFARGREAIQIFSVTSLSETQKAEADQIYERVEVKLESVLKGSTKYRPGDFIQVVAQADDRATPLQIENPLTPGAHFLLLSLNSEDKSRPMDFERCFVLPDTPENCAQLQIGIAQNDTLRHPDPPPSWWNTE